MKRGRNWGAKKESKVISLRLDQELEQWVKNKLNYSEFIRKLLVEAKKEEDNGKTNRGN